MGRRDSSGCKTHWNHLLESFANGWRRAQSRGELAKVLVGVGGVTTPARWRRRCDARPAGSDTAWAHVCRCLSRALFFSLACELVVGRIADVLALLTAMVASHVVSLVTELSASALVT